MKKVLLAVLAMLLLPAGFAFAADKSPLEISGDYRFRFDSLEGTTHDYYDSGMRPGSVNGGVPGFDVKNNGLMTNRFGLNIKAEALEDVRVKARLVMYKVYGHQSNGPTGYNPFMGPFFADRGAANDGTTGHVPGDGGVVVDYAYATVSNVFDQPIWVSVGRRPSTGGAPGNLRLNVEKAGSAGIPNILVDYAFDGGTIGWAPYIESLPGAYVKLCAGRGYDSGYRPNGTVAGKNTDFIGLNVVPYDSDKLHIELQYQLGKNIFDAPSDAPPTTNLGDIEWLGGVVTTKMGNLNLFASAAMSQTDPNNNTSGGAGLLWAGTKEDHSGNAVYVGGRYDMGGTKIGAEFNRGSQYWIGMVPAGDDIWTSKLGTRGSVYEVYIIQELKRAKVSKNGKAFVRLGYQYYDFEYTGSNSWVGAPSKIADLSQTDGMNEWQYFIPVETAKDLYLTFEVEF
jgi:hypothetical protein